MSSKLNINRNIFLEKEELQRFQDFLQNNTVQQVVLENTINWGIVKTVFTGTSPDFLVEVGTNVGTIKIAKTSKAVDIDKLLIYQEAIDNISVPNDGVYYWVKISHVYSNKEVGICSVNVNGEVSGVNTKFTEVIRGQSTEVPVKIKFSNATLNTGVYEVVGITDDLNILLAGTSFVAESNLTYTVIGSTPLGETITSSQLEGLYQYDSCNIELITEESLNTPPITGYIENKQFYIARVVNNSGTVTVEDKRGTQFLTFNVEGINDKLAKDQNLADLTDPAAARANLGVLSAAETAGYFIDSGWKPMISGVAASAANFDLKFRRIGKTCVIQGTYTNGSNVSPDAIIAQIAYSDIYTAGETINGVSQKVWFLCGPQIGNNADNYGIFGYIPTIADSNNSYLYMKVDPSSYGGSFGGKFNINITFFLD